ncbi:unnamed protein product [Arctia plantaginis]|uniref:C-type lectin domain-containing protein n=1 Tax=Arctia plantaginis TaxID=874455 RepID=A0A8S0ZIW7_ARCPL|nr:unnamed protein product [Arctia plantaginis]
MSSLKLISLYICVVFLTLIGVVHSTYELHPEIHGYVKQHKEVATWDEAKKICENEGAILASPVDAQLLKYMKSVITKNNHTIPHFIGLKSKLDGKASFVTQEGVLLEDMPEALDQVEQLDLRNGGCLCMDGYSIRVVQCWTRLPYICYKCNVTEDDVTTTEIPTTTGAPEDCNTGYYFKPTTESYYKFYDDSHAANWEEAKSTCVADGGYLAIPNTYTEARIMKFIAYPLGAYSWAFVYIGIRDLTGNNIWSSVRGEPIKSLYNNFDPKKSRGSCAVLRHDGLLEQYSCYDKLPFICEKNNLGQCSG